MLIYIIAGGAVFITAALSAWLVFAYLSGRNAAKAAHEKRNAEEAAQTANAAKNMLKAKTNGIRSDEELETTLEKGKF